jgi:hypothetical protein
MVSKVAPPIVRALITFSILFLSNTNLLNRISLNKWSVNY